MLDENIFLKIINKEIPAKIVYEDEHCVAFHDITPKAPVHVLIIPRKEIRTHDLIGEEDAPLLGHLHVVADQVVRADLLARDDYHMDGCLRRDVVEGEAKIVLVDDLRRDLLADKSSKML